jgi:hypothetical protein
VRAEYVPLAIVSYVLTVWAFFLVAVYYRRTLRELLRGVAAGARAIGRMEVMLARALWRGLVLHGRRKLWR